MSLVKVAELSEIPEGSAKLVEIEKKQIAIFHTREGFFAVDDKCTHRGGPLSEGTLEGTTVTCPWHKGSFDVTNGRPVAGVVSAALKSYPVKTVGQELMVEI